MSARHLRTLSPTSSVDVKRHERKKERKKERKDLGERRACDTYRWAVMSKYHILNNDVFMYVWFSDDFPNTHTYRWAVMSKYHISNNDVCMYGVQMTSRTHIRIAGRYCQNIVF